MPDQIPKLKAFVLMPFDPEFDLIFNKLIKPALEDVGYEVTRADSFLNQENILKDVVRGIAEADLVVADLTTLNANVFYELDSPVSRINRLVEWSLSCTKPFQELLFRQFMTFQECAR